MLTFRRHKGAYGLWEGSHVDLEGRLEYNKLERDRIPEVIRASGRECGTRVLTREEYGSALREKLVEEGREVAAADGGALVGESGDILELVEALMAAKGIDAAAVREAQAQERADTRGDSRSGCACCGVSSGLGLGGGEARHGGVGEASDGR